MNDGRFDRVNTLRQEKAKCAKAKKSLLRRVDEAKSVDDLKEILRVVIGRAYR